MPLFSVFLAIFFLHERIDRFMVVSMLLAFLGVVVMILGSGSFPLLTIVMSVCFPIYSLLKKYYRLSRDVAMFLESMVLLPFILVFLLFFAKHGIFSYPPTTIFYLILSRPVTASSLLLFGESIKRTPLNLIGFIQYLNPTISLVISVSLLGESSTKADAHSLIFICLSIIIFAIGQFLLFRKKKMT